MAYQICTFEMSENLCRIDSAGTCSRARWSNDDCWITMMVMTIMKMIIWHGGLLLLRMLVLCLGLVTSTNPPAHPTARTATTAARYTSGVVCGSYCGQICSLPHAMFVPTSSLLMNSFVIDARIYVSYCASVVCFEAGGGSIQGCVEVDML